MDSDSCFVDDKRPEDLHRDVVTFIKTAPVDSHRESSVKAWMDRLAEYLWAVKRVGAVVTIPNSYHLVGTRRNDEMIGVVIVAISRLRIPACGEGEVWAVRWGADLVGYIDYLFGLFEDVSDHRVDVPTWQHNINHSWLL